MFWKKNDNLREKNLDSDEYERLLKRILDITAEVAACNSELKLLRTDLANLRGNFNRKLTGIAKEEKAETESFNNSVELPFG